MTGFVSRTIVGVSLLVAGCGANGPFGVPGASAAVPAAGTSAGWSAMPVCFGDTNGQTPSLLRLQDGTWALAFASDRLGDRHLHFTHSSDGNRWSAAQEIAAAGLSDEDPALLQDASGGLHLVFSSNRDGASWQLYESSLQGSTWTAAQPLALPGAMQQAPAIARTASGWVLAYQSGDGMVVAQSADGSAWSPAGEVVPLLDAPAIAQVGDKLIVVAQRRGQLNEVDRDSSGHWSTARQLDLGDGGAVRQPALAVAGPGRALLAFATRSADGAPWGLAISTNNGASWSTPTQAVSGNYDAENPSIQSDPSGRTFLAWGIYRSDGSPGIFFASTADPQIPEPAPLVPVGRPS